MSNKEKQAKVRLVMQEFKSGKLTSGSGEKVTSAKQALAIALSTAGLSRKPKKDMSEDYYMAFLSERIMTALVLHRDKIWPGLQIQTAPIQFIGP